VVRAFSSASCPSAASITWYPAPFSVKATIWRIEAESSTARIDCIGVLRSIASTSKQVDRAGTHAALAYRLQARRGQQWIDAVGEPHQHLLQLAEAALRVRGELVRHVLELQRRHGTANSFAQPALLVRIALCLRCERGHEVEAGEQLVAGIADHRLQAFQI